MTHSTAAAAPTWFTPAIAAVVGAAFGAAVGAALTLMLLRGAARRRAALHRARQETLQNRLRQLDAQLASQQLVLQSMTTGILALDMQHRILSLNAAAERLLGITASTALGRLLPEVVRSPELHRFVEDAFAGGGTARREVTIDSATAGILDLAAEPLLDPAGRTSGLLVAADDVTAERRLESMRSDFAANVSHELRTPITNIKGYVDTLLEIGMDQPDRARHFLTVVQENAQRLARLVEDVLALSSLEQRQARRRLQFEPVDLSALVERVIEDLGGAAEGRGIRIERRVPPGASVIGVGSLLAQALANLLQNAIQYGPAHAVVRIEIDADERDGAVLAVSDQGPGIAAKHLPRLFERFYRVDKGRARDAGGTGLGLAIVKHIALLHGGRVSVESEQGRGSTFRMHLPATPPLDDDAGD